MARQLHAGAEGELHARRHQRRELGRLLNTQQFNKDFAERLVQDARRARAGRCRAARAAAAGWSTSATTRGYKRIYEIKTKDDAKSWADLIALSKVLNETPADKLEAALAPILDVDGA